MNPLLQALETNQRRPVQQSQNFLVEIEGPDSVFTTEQCREVTVSLGSIEVEEISSGTIRFGLPKQATVSRLELTFALDGEGKIVKYFKDWKNKVMNNEGYFGIPFGPNGYIRRATISALSHETLRPEFEVRQMLVYPENLGQLNFTVKDTNAMEMQVTLCRFMAERGKSD